MNAEQFEAWYAQRSGTTVEALHQHGRWAELCRCSVDCPAWLMGHQWEDALIEEQLRGGATHRQPASLARPSLWRHYLTAVLTATRAGTCSRRSRW